MKENKSFIKVLGECKMNKRGAGVSFLAISAFLLAAKYISAAMFGSGVTTWDEKIFDAMIKSVGFTLNTFSILALIAGILYLLAAEKEDLNKKA